MKKGKVYLVMRDTDGEWRPYSVLSIWDNKDKATAEAIRVNRNEGRTRYGDAAWVVEVLINQPSDYDIDIEDFEQDVFKI